MMMKTVLLASTFLAVFVTGPAVAGKFTTVPQETLAIQVSDAQTAAALNFVTKATAEGMAFLQDANLSKAQRKAKFRALLNRHFDLNTIGRFALGPNWRNATPSEQQQYLKLFNTMVVEVYNNRFDEYKGEKLMVQGVKALSGTDSLVTSYIVPVDGGQKVQIDWRVRNKGGSQRVVDVIVEGVSMSVTQRSEFASIIQQGGGKVSHLIDHLRAKVSGKS